jgi:hypothetical protein
VVSCALALCRWYKLQTMYLRCRRCSVQRDIMHCFSCLADKWYGMALESLVVMRQVDPVKGNVIFSSAIAGWSFSLRSFAQLYIDVTGASFDPRCVP